MEALNPADASIEFAGASFDPRVKNGRAYDVHGPFEVPENIKTLYLPKFGVEIRRETGDASCPKAIFFYTETILNFVGHAPVSCAP
jgi:hypothetical protein